MPRNTKLNFGFVYDAFQATINNLGSLLRNFNFSSLKEGPMCFYPKFHQEFESEVGNAKTKKIWSPGPFWSPGGSWRPTVGNVLTNWSIFSNIGTNKCSQASDASEWAFTKNIGKTFHLERPGPTRPWRFLKLNNNSETIKGREMKLSLKDSPNS